MAGIPYSSLRLGGLGTFLDLTAQTDHIDGGRSVPEMFLCGMQIFLQLGHPIQNCKTLANLLLVEK